MENAGTFYRAFNLWLLQQIIWAADQTFLTWIQLRWVYMKHFYAEPDSQWFELRSGGTLFEHSGLWNMEPPVGKQRKCIPNRNKIIYAYALTKNRTRQKKFQRERGTKKIQTAGLLQGLNLFMFLSDEIMLCFLSPGAQVSRRSKSDQWVHGQRAGRQSQASECCLQHRPEWRDGGSQDHQRGDI